MPRKWISEFGHPLAAETVCSESRDGKVRIYSKKLAMHQVRTLCGLGAEFVLGGHPPLSSAFERDSERPPLRRREPSPSNPAIFDCDQNDAVRVNLKFLEFWSQIFE